MESPESTPSDVFLLIRVPQVLTLILEDNTGNLIFCYLNFLFWVMEIGLEISLAPSASTKHSMKGLAQLPTRKRPQPEHAKKD